LATALSSKELFNILELPKYLQTTVLALIKAGPCTAQSICNVTEKARAVESSYLNQLVTMKLAQKQRKRTKGMRGRYRVFFTVDLEALKW
jgi:hypothetical protein